MEAPVWQEDGSQVGTVRWQVQGGWTEVSMVCRGDDGGLFRGFLVCEKGELPLGVLAPEGQCLHISRRFSQSELGRMGPIRHGLRRLSYAFARSGEVWRPVTDGFFRHRPPLEHIEGALWKEEGGGRVLAIPWDCKRAFPLMELMCFVRVRTIQGQSYGTLAFDADEWPRMG